MEKNVQKCQEKEQGSIQMIDKETEEVFSIERIEIEELGIDGICGVY